MGEMRRDWLRENGAYWTAGDVREYGKEFFASCPWVAGEKGLRLVMMTSGAAIATSQGGDVSLGGSRMLLSFLDYRLTFKEVTPDARCLAVDLIPKRDAPIGDSLYDMYDKYPQYRRYCQSPDEALAFDDRFGLVYTTAQALTHLTSDRWIFSRMYAYYIILVITCQADESSRFSASGNRHIRKAMKYVYDNCSMPIKARDVAANVQVNPSHLRRLFLLETGQTPGEHIARQRMERVRFLLIHTDFPICEIARLTGFSSQQYLSGAFKKRFGISPIEFRTSYNVTCGYRRLAEYDTLDLPWEAI